MQMEFFLQKYREPPLNTTDLFSVISKLKPSLGDKSWFAKVFVVKLIKWCIGISVFHSLDHSEKRLLMGLSCGLFGRSV